MATLWIKSVLGIFFGGEDLQLAEKGILLMWINFLYSRPEALCGASCTKTHFIHCLGSSRQANIQSNATLLQPHVCFFNEIVNQERSESCYITEGSIFFRKVLWKWTKQSDWNSNDLLQSCSLATGTAPCSQSGYVSYVASIVPI